MWLINTTKYDFLTNIFVPYLSPALLSGIMYKNQIHLALQGSPPHRSSARSTHRVIHTFILRFFLDGQKTQLAEIACSGQTALISRYFFYTDLRDFGCDPRYFTLVQKSVLSLLYIHNY